MNIDAYLRRIRYDGPTTPTIETLQALHLAHLLAVPFENLDIHLGRAITLDERRLHSKIVEHRRGGFCYELNGSFTALLHALEFRVSLLSACVSRHDGSFGPEFDHLLLLVDVEDRWLADVGFGDSFVTPLKLTTGVQEQDGSAYRIDRIDRDLYLARRAADGVWKTQYRFTLRPRSLTDFAGMCHYHQTSPESHFTRGRVCTQATPSGRVTLSDERLIVTVNGERREIPVDSEATFRRYLSEHFGIDLSENGGPDH